MKKEQKLKLIVILAICLAVLSGCWDKIEIEDRLFVLAMGIDKTKKEEMTCPEDRYTMSFVSPIVSKVKEGDGATFKTYKTVDNSPISALTKLMERFAKKQYFGHSRGIIFGEELLKDEELLKEVLDGGARYHEIHESMYAFAVQGRAEEVFDVEPLFDRLIGTYISGLADNSDYVSMIFKLTLGELITKIKNQKGNVVIPRMAASKHELKVDGAAVIKNYKLIGYLSDDEVVAYNWVTDNAEGGIISVEFRDVSTTFMHYRFGRRIKLDKIEEGKIYLNYEMEIEGSVEEYKLGSNLMDVEILKEMEKEIEKKMVGWSEQLIKKFQEEYKVDLIGAGNYLSKYHPKIYKTIEKDYDRYFQDNIVINVTAEAHIRRVGLIR